MARAQGSLEYLVIIAVVLAISSIVMLYATGIIGTQKSSVSISTCKQASIDCKLSKISSPTDSCTQCDTSCKDLSTGLEVTYDAVRCCKSAKPDMIYDNSPGCAIIEPFTVTLTNPTTGSVKASPVTITATTNRAATCTYSVSGSASSPMTTTDQLTHTASVTISTEGSATVTVTCNDGSSTAASSPRQFYVDNTAPAVPRFTTTSPFIGPVMLNANSSDNIGVAKIEFYIAGNKFPPAPDSGCTFNSLISTPVKCSRMWNSTSVADGTRLITVVVTDFAGHTTQQSWNGEVSNAGATLACGTWVKCSPTRSTIADCYANYPAAAPYNNYCCFTGQTSCLGGCCYAGSCCTSGGLSTCCFTGTVCYNPEAGKIACKTP